MSDNDRKDNLLTISVIIPVLNAEVDIDKCIYSLINQDYPKDRYEIIIVDNGSIDGTINIINKYHENVKIVHEFEKGSYIARNKGIQESNNEIIAFTDSDCIISKDWLKEICKGFISEDIGCVVGAINPYPGKTLVEIYSGKKDVLSQEITINHRFLPYGATANVAFRRDVFNKIGNFDKELMSGGDADLAWRMQLLTTYKLTYRRESIVQHHHRTTIKNLFKQHFRYGIGSALLYKKYGNSMKYGVKQSLSDWLKLAINEFSISIKKMIKDHDRYYIFEPLLTFVCTTGYRTGRLYGSVKLKLFYV